MGNKLIECVPNYSEGRDLEKIEKIVECFRAKKGVRLLDYQTDPNHNRLVVTVIGEPEPLRDAVVASFGRAVELVDMTKHEGQHPRMGAVDVVPFIPCRNATLEEADALAKEVAKTGASSTGSPASYTSLPRRLPTERTWPASARASLREWQRRCRIQKNGLRISDRPLPIPQQASAQWEPGCRWWPIT